MYIQSPMYWLSNQTLKKLKLLLEINVVCMELVQLCVVEGAMHLLDVAGRLGEVLLEGVSQPLDGSNELGSVTDSSALSAFMSALSLTI